MENEKVSIAGVASGALAVAAAWAMPLACLPLATCAIVCGSISLRSAEPGSSARKIATLGAAFGCVALAMFATMVALVTVGPFSAQG